MGANGTPPSLLLSAFCLAVCSIAAFVTLAPTCPALVIDAGSGKIEVPMLEDYTSFISNRKKALGALPTVSDWDPWLQTYPIAVIATVGGAPILLLLASLITGTDRTDERFVVAAATVIWAGNLAAGVYYLMLLSYSNQNTTTTCNVVPGMCTGPLLIGSAFASQIVLLLNRWW